jgi:hypothetical protein
VCKMQSFRMFQQVGHAEPLGFEKLSRNPQQSAAQPIETISEGLDTLPETKILFSHHDICVP